MNNLLKIIPISLLLFTIGCGTLFPSPEPGIITVKVATEPSALDSLGIIEGDAFFIKINDIRAYRSNEDYAIIYDSLGAYSDVDRIINTFKLLNDTFVVYEIGRTWFPPEEFVEIRLSAYISPVVDTTIDTVIAEIETTEVWVDTTQTPWDTINVICDTTYTIDTVETESNVLILGGIRCPLEMPDTASPLVSLPDTFNIQEHDTTQILLIFDPVASLKRKLDTYQFFPTFRVSESSSRSSP